MKCVIVDDEFRGREVLASLLASHCPGVKVCGMAASVSSAVEVIRNTHPDVVFLDIEMPDGTGFDLLGRFSPPPFKTVFVTSFDQYAIRAVRFHAFDYLLKPVIVEELKQAVSRLGNDENHPPRDPEPGILEINNKTRLDYVRLDDVLFLKGDGNYTFIHAVNGQSYHTSRVLREYEDILCNLKSPFVRVHKSYIINLRYAEGFRHDANRGLLLSNGTLIEVSRRRKDEVLMRFREYKRSAQ